MARSAFLQILLVLSCSFAVAEPTPYIDKVVLHQNGKSVPLQEHTLLVPFGGRLLGSCSVDASESHQLSSEWEKIIDSTNYFWFVYKQSAAFEIAGQQYRIQEILIPLPPKAWPSYVYGRMGSNIYAFSKFKPKKLADLVCQERVGLKKNKPYIDLCHDWIPSPL